MHIYRLSVRIFPSICLLVLVLSASACGKRQSPVDDGELEWARTALQRNPQLQVIATDTGERVFTIKHRVTGQVSTVAMKDLAAVPIAQIASLPGARSDTSMQDQSPPAAELAQSDTSRVTGTNSASDGTTPADTESVAAANTGADQYVIQREDGRLRVSGPGVSIVSAQPADMQRAAAQPHRSSTPVICDGQRFMHLDGRNISVDGTAVIARRGCELHITNSEVQASAVAVRIEDATVHISNSGIRGAVASIETAGRARLFIRDTEFQGISRRGDRSQILDQGGNSWR